MIVRFDDLGQQDTPLPPRKPPIWRGGKTVDAPLTVQPLLSAGYVWPTGIDQANTTLSAQKQQQQGYALMASGASPGGPQQQTTSSDGRTFKILNIVPIKATLNRNGIRMADTLSLTLRFNDFPFDPRSLRACGIQFYLGSLSPDLFHQEVTGTVPVSLPDTYVDSYGKQRANLRFEGWADEYTEQTDDDGEATVTLACTDNTRLLLDTEAPQQGTIDPSKPIDLAIATYLANFPQFVGLTIQYRPIGATPPTMAGSLAKTAMRPNNGPPASGGAGAGKTSVFDYLTDICGTLGLIVFVEDTTIVIQRPRTLYASKFSGRADDPFTGRILPSGRTILNRLFLYGRNVSHYGFKRKFTKAAPQNIEVRCFSAKTGQVLIERFPGLARDGTRQPKLLPGDNADETWHVHTVYGIEDRAVLRAIAQGVYEQQSRAEFTTHFATQNLGSYGGGPQDPDMLDAQAGDAIEFEIAQAPNGETSRGLIASQMATNPAGYLQSLGFDPALAASYAATMANVGMTSTYRIRSIAFDWDAEAGTGDSGGINVDVECVNFLEVRSSKDLPAGEEIEPVTAGTAPQPVTVSVSNPTAGPALS